MKIFTNNLATHSQKVSNRSIYADLENDQAIPKVQTCSLMVDDVLQAMVDIEKVTAQINSVANRASKEEDVKIGIERVLGDVAQKFGLQPAFYEYTFVDGGRADALYGKLIIEYEGLNSLQNKTKRNASIVQLKDYITKHSKSKEDLHKHLGISIDGKNILFVRYNEQTNDWIEGEPFPINVETIGRLLEALRGLKRKPLDVDVMLLDFGPNSDNAKKIVQDLYHTPLQTNRGNVLFEDWKRVFKQAVVYSPDKAKGLEIMYGITNEKIDYEKLLFSIHTYYAFLMKIVAAEVVTLYGEGKFIRSYFNQLLEAQFAGKLKEKLKEIEEGTIFRRFMNIENFMEADYFSWYMDEWNDDLSKDLGLMIKLLSDYEVATADLKPEKVRDLFKRLYQNLMPKKIRHDMGEYYTPDWLAELLLDEIGFTVTMFEQLKQHNGSLPPTLRLLDPACGSGTFLVLAIKRLKEYADQHYIDAALLVRHILRNVVGFDLNPLAAIAARTNYLLALGDLLRFVGTTVEIPVFLADSIMLERSSTLTGESYILRTIVGEFQIPRSLAETATLAKVLELISDCVNINCEPHEFEARLKNEINNFDDNELYLLKTLYRQFKTLEDQGKNKIWTGIIKNSFAPLYQAKFDYVVGNPPWINWSHLPEEYRESTKSLWKNYGLMRESKKTGMGRVKRDLASLFVARCYDQYLLDTGRLAFLIPFNIIKTEGADGFRSFLANKTDVMLVQDLSETYPFEGATNRTGMIVIKRGRTSFPIFCRVWSYDKSTGVDQDLPLKVVQKITKQFKLDLFPIYKSRPESPWITITKKSYSAIGKIVGPSTYKAYAGVYTALIALYWVKIKSNIGKYTHIENLGEGKKKVPVEQAAIEKDLLYPLVRGRDVKKWYEKSIEYILVPHNTKTGKPLDESTMKVKYPKSFQFLLKHKEMLENRPIHKLWGKGNPFYSLYNIGTYAFSDYKVAWKDISGKISARGEFGGAVVLQQIKDKHLGNVQVIPDDTLLVISCNSEDEAYYVAAFLNSIFIRFVVTVYAVLHVRGHLLKYVNILPFNKDNHIDKELSALSKKAHELAKKYYEEKKITYAKELKKVEAEIDITIAKLFGISNDELKEIENVLKILKE